MTGDVLTCSPGDSVIQILEIMSERRIRHVPVVEDGNLVGMVSIRDLMQHMLKHDAARIKDMMMSIYEKSGAYPWA